MVAMCPDLQVAAGLNSVMMSFEANEQSLCKFNVVQSCKSSHVAHTKGINLSETCMTGLVTRQW